MNNYTDFLAKKTKSNLIAGFDSDATIYNLFDFQSAIVSWACKRGRAGIFADTGLGKTAMQVAWADQVIKHTQGRVLILAPLCVAQQTVKEAARIGVEVEYARSGNKTSASIVITNYEMMDHFSASDFIGVVLDESSILKSLSGKIRTALIESFQNTPYRLSCTATPSPNDFMELGNQAEFLGVMTRTEMLATYFIHDGGDTSKWRLKGHGKTKFWEWMATWSVCIRSPEDIGFYGSRYILPGLDIHQHTVEAQFIPDGQLFPVVAQTLSDRRAAKRASMEDRVELVDLLIKSKNDKIGLNIQNNRSEIDGLETRVPGESEAENCGRPGVSREIPATKQERPGKAKGLSSRVLQEQPREVQEDSRESGDLQRNKEEEIRGRSEIQGTGEAAIEGVAECKSNQKKRESTKETRNKTIGLPRFTGQTERRMCDLRVLGYERSEDVPSCGSLPQDGECSRIAVHELQSRAREVQRQCGFSSISSDVYSLQKWVVWCHLNSEQDSLERLLKKNGITFVSISGATKIDDKIKYESEWRLGSVQVMITKPSVFGFGMNWQHCHNMIFVGMDDSYESYYQAVRRCYRFGQKNKVNVHIISSESEGEVKKNIERKAAQADEMSRQMVAHMRKFTTMEIKGISIEKSDYSRDLKSGDGFDLHLGDCVEVTQEMEEESIDYTVFSPPFASLYTYSNSDRDMGNSRNHSEFYAHFEYLISELFRVTRSGRLLSFHCMNLPATIQNDGFIGIKDFRGELIRLFVDAGWIFHSEVVIWKDPVTAMQRTKAIGLLYKQLKKDSCISRQGIPDYLVTMRKPGDNPAPVTKNPDEFPVGLWQRYASPVWMDINPSNTLQFRSARESDDERHICPLQLEVIERAVDLWTNPGDLVYSPFAGIGSEGYVAIQKGRRFVGAELKRSYWDLACRNLASAKSSQGNLLDLAV